MVDYTIPASYGCRHQIIQRYQLSTLSNDTTNIHLDDCFMIPYMHTHEGTTNLHVTRIFMLKNLNVGERWDWWRCGESSTRQCLPLDTLGLDWLMAKVVILKAFVVHETRLNVAVYVLHTVIVIIDSDQNAMTTHPQCTQSNQYIDQQNNWVYAPHSSQQHGQWSLRRFKETTVLV